MDALVRFYYKVDPEELDDDKLYQLRAEVMWVLKFNGTIQEKQ